jgi:hypothetical protein
MNWFRNFMYGRYGTDQLNLALLVSYLVFCLLASFTGIGLFNLIALAAVIFCIYRMFSRDIARRSRENQTFLTKMQPVFRWWRQLNARVRDRDHRYYRCPCCKQVLRVPRGRGKIAITCPRCRTVLNKKT